MMNKPFPILCTCVSLVALALLLGRPAPAATPASSPANPSSASVASKCLGCHGPFDKLTSATANYKMPSGEQTSPHRYVPHNSKNIPECDLCHKPHPLPLTKKEGLPKPNEDYCYSCHHTGGLQCGSCHEVPQH